MTYYKIGLIISKQCSLKANYCQIHPNICLLHMWQIITFLLPLSIYYINYLKDGPEHRTRPPRYVGNIGYSRKGLPPYLLGSIYISIEIYTFTVKGRAPGGVDCSGIYCSHQV